MPLIVRARHGQRLRHTFSARRRALAVADENVRLSVLGVLKDLIADLLNRRVLTDLDELEEGLEKITREWLSNA